MEAFYVFGVHPGIVKNTITLHIQSQPTFREKTSTMRNWHFLVTLLPEAGLIRQFGSIPMTLDESYNEFDDIDDEELSDQPEYWKNFAYQDELISDLSSILVKRASWSPDINMFGTKDMDEIEIWMTDDWKILEIMIAFDAREPNPDFIRTILSTSARFGLMLKSVRLHDVFSPAIRNYILNAEKCRSSRFLPNDVRLTKILDEP
jgi:hypothetical protein